LLIAALLAAGAPAVLGAQATAGSGAGTEGGAASLAIESPDGAYRLQIGGSLQADGRLWFTDPPGYTESFTIRKARPIFAVRLTRRIEAHFTPDFVNGGTLISAYIETRFSPAFRVRIGKDKTPVGYEFLQGDTSLLFPERALPSSLVPGRDVGIQAIGDLAAGRLSYAGGLFNGVPDGSSLPIEVDENNRKDWAGRVVMTPFHRSDRPATALDGLGLHFGAATGVQHGSLPSFHTSVGQTYFSYIDAFADGRHTRIAPAVFYYYKTIGLFGEYVSSRQAVANAAGEREIDDRAWEVTASIVLTGEPAGDRGVHPRARFDPEQHHWGAVQVASRIAALRVSPTAVAAGVAAPTASRGANQFTVDVIWYPNVVVRYYFTYERTRFTDPISAPRPIEHVLLLRAQVSF
jgi:phosphate-selective porin OprO/OprP